ncbi:MAG: hypothetical protein JNK17_16510 [Hydrogenophaga sp.]|nr:hypothetical protein [Hydrogenophaga sp.]
MQRTFLFFVALASMTVLFACGGGSSVEEHYEGRYTYNGVTYHCTSSEAGDPCRYRADCSKCDKV